MNSEIKYPAIYSTPLQSVYLYLDKDNYCSLSFPTSGTWLKSSELDDNSQDKNITHEYLSNTWGVVESKEHAEFIIELAELHGFEFGGYCERADTYFYFSDDYLGFVYSDKLASSRNEKQITIPLPPSASVDELTPEEEFELHQNQAVQQANCRCEFVDMETWPQVGSKVTTYGQQGDVILPADKNGFYIINADGLYLAAKEKDITECEEIESEDTWLQVGDEVCWSNGHRKGELKCIHDGWAWVKVDEDDFASIKTDKLTKPKSKEDLLIEELQTKLCENNYVDNYTLANDIVNGMIEGLSYGPK